MEIRLRILLALVLNALSSAIRLLAGLLLSSMALLADGLDSCINVLTGFVTLRYFERARQPPDIDHPYGHLRLEALPALLTSHVMVALAVLLIAFSATRLTAGLENRLSPLAIPAALLSLSINAASMLLLRGAKESLAAQAEAKHLSADVLESALVLVGVTLAWAGSRMWDVLTASAVGVYMLAQAAMTIRETLEYLVDVSPGEEFVRRAQEAALAIPEVSEVHKIRARRVGRRIFVDLHVVVDGSMSVERAHEIAHAVERAIKRIDGVIDVTVHIEPGPRSAQTPDRDPFKRAPLDHKHG